MQFVRLTAFKTLGNRQLRGHRATAAVSPLLKGVNGCRGHSVVTGLGLKPLWIKRLVRIHRASRPIILAASVSLRERRSYGSPEETHTGDDKENRSGKRGRRAPPEAKSPLRLVSVDCNPAPDAEHRLRDPWFQVVEDRLLRERDVCEMVAVSRSTLWRWVRTGSFPAPIRIGVSAVRWQWSAVQEWMASKAS